MSRAPYIETGDAKLCTACAACAFVCPTKAISMREDACGFVYPLVDEGACIGCEKCLAACHMARPDDFRADAEPAAYGAYDKDAGALRRSASGGVATLLCRETVDGGGVAYGCVARRESISHERLATRDELELARGSKYVQSDISRSFLEIKNDIASGRKVAFVGTPCQCAALRALFGDRSNLLLIDLVCEGVPSQKMYADFLDDLERERGEKVSDFRFRDKRRGWTTKNAVVVGEGGRPLEKQPYSYYYYYYYWLFVRSLILRDSCYACPYACVRRVGDVTIGDFWGAEASGLGYRLSELRAGISCVLVSTTYGKAAMDNAAPSLDSRPVVDPMTIARSNSCLVHPASCDIATRQGVLNAYEHGAAQDMRQVYCDLFGKIERIKAWSSANAPLSVRVLAKRMKSFATTLKEGE